ncbi:MAG: tRNA (adenosine(37)-N6)-threonylcarbamoyltransferase complex ATPase subunit type 1 TsaE [Gemmatimonadota bacterium]
MSPAGRQLTEGELIAWGEEFGRGLRPPVVVALSGDLGAGKTTLTQAICRGYGVRDEVTSPTFAIVHVYEAPRSSVHHVDLYRLDGTRDLQNIGWDDLVRGESILIVEWPERAQAALPADAVALELRFVDGDPTRRLLLERTSAGATA